MRPVLLVLIASSFFMTSAQAAPGASSQAVRNARGQNAATGGGSGVIRVGNELHGAGTGKTSLDIEVDRGRDPKAPVGTWWMGGKLMHMTPWGVREANVPEHLVYAASHPDRIPRARPSADELTKLLRLRDEFRTLERAHDQVSLQIGEKQKAVSAPTTELEQAKRRRDQLRGDLVLIESRLYKRAELKRVLAASLNVNVQSDPMLRGLLDIGTGAERQAAERHGFTLLRKAIRAADAKARKQGAALRAAQKDLKVSRDKHTRLSGELHANQEEAHIADVILKIHAPEMR